MRLAEELVTMVTDPGDLPHRTLRYAMAGAVLLDLALEGRIDTDSGRLWPVDPTPLDDDLLDPTLAEIVAGGTDSPETWVRHVARGGDALYDRTVSRLAALGLMELDDAGVASPPHPEAFVPRRPPADALAQTLATVFQEGAIPSPRAAHRSNFL